MEQKYRLEKIGQPARVMTPRGRKHAGIGYIYECINKTDFDHKMRWESHHWKDITEYPKVAEPKPKPTPKKKSKKGAK